jgi:glycosyltransferase involved in cell wall biosynthesis
LEKSNKPVDVISKITYSVIIPVFNVEKSILNTINSINIQYDNNFEILLIDDHSKDGTSLICKKIANKYKYIKFYSNPKKGVSSARNFGIKKASGKYIVFVDADDTIADNYFQIINSHVKNDLLIFGFQFINQNNDIINEISCENTIFDHDDFIMNYLLRYIDNSLMYSVCNKVFSKKIITNNNVLFNENYSFNEDILFCLNYLKYCKRIENISTILYNYYYDTNGLSKNYKDNSFDSLNDVYNDVLINYNEKDDEFLNTLFFNKILENIMKICISKNICFNIKISELKKIRKSTFFYRTLKNSDIKGKNIIIKILMYLHFYIFVVVVYNVNNIIKTH